MYLPAGTLLQGGKYEIIRYISSGGFGCTYEARNTAFRNKAKTVAIKEFFVKDFCNRDASSNEIVVGTSSKAGLVDKLRNKFIEEAEALYGMNHPNVVRVTDFFEENSTAYYVMDYIDGAPLSSLIERRGRLSESESLGYIRQVAEALDYIHSQNRLHLDVKPQNIMIDGNGKAILIDFGVSKQYDEANGENTSTLLGSTPGYAPIEQSGHTLVKFNAATDIYSLGATLYKSLTGTTPVEAVLRASGRKMEKLVFPEIVSDSVCHAIEHSMQISRTKRPQSIAEFLSLLNGVGKNPGDSTDMEIRSYEDIPKNREGIAEISNSAIEKWNSFDSLFLAAMQGDSDAQYNLGLCYQYGDGVAKRMDEAMRWYNIAVENGNASAMNRLGLCYLEGQDVEKSYDKAVEYFRMAINKGDLFAQNNLAVCYYNGYGVSLSYYDAAEWFRKSAEQGLAEAQNYLGLCYEKGEGVPQSYAEAVKWYRLGADQGHAVAQNNLGLCYANGEGVPQSYTEAVKWIRKSAEQEFDVAQFNLGFFYEKGYGVLQSIEEANKWYRLAAKQGNKDAELAIKRLGKHGCVMLIVLIVAIALLLVLLRELL